ncbi:MAG: hypothetical protein AAGF23_01895 [Acidobacteriota bacterium]
MICHSIATSTTLPAAPRLSFGIAATWLSPLILILFALGSADPAGATPLVTWQQELIRSGDGGPRLAVGAQGRVELHVPAFLRGAGTFAFELTPDELATLRRDVARLDGLDVAALREAQLVHLRSAAASGAVMIQAGASRSVFHIEGVGELAWRGLRFDASRVDDWRLELLADLERRFEGWLRDPRRRPAARGVDALERRP